jgi:hypothetical protein
VLTSYLPGQEEGNAEFVVQAGAGSYAAGLRGLAAEVARLRRDPVALAAMRAASARLGRPRAAADIADLLAQTAKVTGTSALTRTQRRQPAALIAQDPLTAGLERMTVKDLS